MRRVILTLLLLLAALCGTASAQESQGAVSEEKRRDIIRLLELTKAADIGEQIIRQMTETLRENFAMLPAEQRDKMFKIFEEEMGKEFNKEKMIEVIVPIYDRYVSAEDVKALIAFYETPLGRRAVDALPAISREAYEDGARRGREAGLRVMTRLLAEGLMTPPATAPPAAKPKPKPKPRARRGRA
jgi:hypothetical protein